MMARGIKVHGCSVDDCDSPHYGRGWCQLHYWSWYVHGDPLATTRPKPKRACSVSGCDKRHYAHDLCATHYTRWRRHGDPLVVKSSGHPHVPLEVRFWPKVDKAGPVPERRPDLGPCWLWTGAMAARGRYGKIKHRGRFVTAHRVAYELSVGPIPSGLELDHLCMVTQCVRPEHLEPVTRIENERRKMSAPHPTGRMTPCS